MSCFVQYFSMFVFMGILKSMFANTINVVSFSYLSNILHMLLQAKVVGVDLTSNTHRYEDVFCFTAQRLYTNMLNKHESCNEGEVQFLTTCGACSSCTSSQVQGNVNRLSLIVFFASLPSIDI